MSEAGTNLQNRFDIIGCDDSKAEAMLRPSITFWQDSWRRFKKNKVAVIAAILLIAIGIFTLVVPMISPNDFAKINTVDKNMSPSAKYWFGTDELGRDLFVRVAIGGRISIIIGICCTMVQVLVGTLYGGISGYFGGIVDDIMMRIVEIIGSIPYLVVVILISLIMGKSVFALVFAMTVIAWDNTARLVRGQVMQLKEMEFIHAERALGSGPSRIIIKHMLPNVLGIIIVRATLSVPGFIFTEAFLSYIGLGVVPPDTSWGALAAAAQQKLMFYPYMLFYPCLFISLTMLAFTLMGDGLTDALDPKLRQ